MSDAKIYCEVCGGYKQMTIAMVKDEFFPDQGIWGDIFCSDCNFVIASVSGDAEVEYKITNSDTTIEQLKKENARQLEKENESALKYMLELSATVTSQQANIQKLAEALSEAATDLEEFNSQNQQSTNKEYRKLAQEYINK